MGALVAGAVILLGIGVAALARRKRRARRRPKRPRRGSLEREGVGLRFELKIPENARPYVSPASLIWRGLPAESRSELRRLFPIASDTFDSDSEIIWVRRVIDATKRGLRWFHGSDGAWGQRDRDAIASVANLLRYWTEIARETSELTARQVSADLEGPVPSDVRRVDNYARHPEEYSYAFVTQREGRVKPGLARRWPLEVHVLSKAIELELAWATRTFDLLDTIMDQVVDGTAFVETAGGYRLDAGVRDELDALVGFGTGLRGPGLELGMPHRYAPVFAAMSADIESFVLEARELARAELQEHVLTPVREILDEMANSISDDLRAAIPFVDTLAAGLAVTGPWGLVAGLVIEFVATLMDVLGGRRRRRRDFTVDALPRGPAVYYTHRGIEIYVQMMYRALHAQEVRIAAMVDGASWLFEELRPLDPGDVRGRAPIRARALPAV